MNPLSACVVLLAEIRARVAAENSRPFPDAKMLSVFRAWEGALHGMVGYLEDPAKETADLAADLLEAIERAEGLSEVDPSAFDPLGGGTE